MGYFSAPQGLRLTCMGALQDTGTPHHRDKILLLLLSVPQVFWHNPLSSKHLHLAAPQQQLLQAPSASVVISTGCTMVAAACWQRALSVQTTGSQMPGKQPCSHFRTLAARGTAAPGKSRLQRLLGGAMLDHSNGCSTLPPQHPQTPGCDHNNNKQACGRDGAAQRIRPGAPPSLMVLLPLLKSMSPGRQGGTSSSRLLRGSLSVPVVPCLVEKSHQPD